MKFIIYFLILLSLLSCETREQKINLEDIKGKWYLNKWTTFLRLEVSDSSIFVDNHVDTIFTVRYSISHDTLITYAPFTNQQFKNRIILLTKDTLVLDGIMDVKETRHYSRSKRNSKMERNTGCTEFEFKNLNKDTNKWKEEAAFEPLSDSFFKEHIYHIKELRYTNPASLYKVCSVVTDKLTGLVIAEVNGPTWYMYFIPESGDKTFVLACVEASLDYYLTKKSKLLSDGNLEMIVVHGFDEGKSVIKDSVVTRYSIEKNQFVKIKSDSIRSFK